MGIFDWKSTPEKRDLLKFHRLERGNLRRFSHEIIEIIKSNDSGKIKVLHLNNSLRNLSDLEARLNEAQENFRNKKVDMSILLKLRHDLDHTRRVIESKIIELERDSNKLVK